MVARGEALVFLCVAGLGVALACAFVAAAAAFWLRHRPGGRRALPAALLSLACLVTLVGLLPVLLARFAAGEHDLRAGAAPFAEECAATGPVLETVTRYGAAPSLLQTAVARTAWALGYLKELPRFNAVWDRVRPRAERYFSWPVEAVYRLDFPPSGVVAASIGFRFADAVASEDDLTPRGSFSLACTGNRGGFEFRPLSPRIVTPGQFIEPPAFSIPEQCLAGEGTRITVRWDDQTDYRNARVAVGSISGEVLAQPRRSPPVLAGFAAKESVVPGETLELGLASPSGHADLAIYRIGRARELVYRREGIPAPARPYSPLAGRDGVDWPLNFSLAVPRDWKPGYYQFELKDPDATAYGYFLVERPADARGRLAVIASTNTWQAYNAWGGQSLYRFDLGECIGLRISHRVSFRRPYAIGATLDQVENRAAHLVQAESLIGAWLDDRGIAYDPYPDRRLHETPDLLLGYDTVVLTSHPEYWSREMRRALDRHLERGGNLVYLGGNGLYERVTISGETMEGYNHRQYHEMDDELGGFYYLLGQPQSAVLGVEYDAHGYMKFYPYEVRSADHWVFEGTGLRQGDLFGFGEMEGAPIAAAGHETDKRTRHSPANTVLLARGAGEGGAEMVAYDHPGGGFVYSVGSIAYALTLDQDPVQGRILENVMRRALARRPGSP